MSDKVNKTDADDDSVASNESLAFNEKDSTSEEFSSVQERDEVKEVHKMSAKDTRRVQLLRLAATLVLLGVAFSVTFASYTFLKKEEKSNFETAFGQFSRTVAEAALDFQSDIRDSLVSLSHDHSVYASTNNLTWPFVTYPQFETIGADRRKQGKVELICNFHIVKAEDKDAYLEYINGTYINMVNENHMLQAGNLDRLVPDTSLYNPSFVQLTPEGFVPDDEHDVYFPIYQLSPPPNAYALSNWNFGPFTAMSQGWQPMMELRNETVTAMVMPYAEDTQFTKEQHAAMHSDIKKSSAQHPHVFSQYPIHKIAGDTNSEIVGLVGSGQALDRSLLGLLPEGVNGITCVIKNNFNQTYTYEIHGYDAYFLGEEDLHETKYDDMEVIVNLALHTHRDFLTLPGHAIYTMHIYPTTLFQDTYDSNTPEVFATIVAVTFVLVAIMFFMYDVFVQKRNANLVAKAAQSNAIVTSMFPDIMRDRLMGDKEEEAKKNASKNKKGNLRSFLNDNTDGGDGGIQNSKPLADLYLETTVLFADISGFTAWSSVREPTQVFTLLENVYQAFDFIAKRRRIFKVETVGDCYVAVCGLPDPRPDHAVCMCRFAKDIISRFHVLSKDLEMILGPDTGDLDLRVGIHTGPVTAGILRGERARFQLFGDTMNTTARIESTGQRGRIQCSKETAEQIVKAGKSSWLQARVDRVQAKGKGEMETFWVAVDSRRAGSVRSAASSSNLSPEVFVKSAYGKSLPGLDAKTYRLIDWNVESLLGIMKEVVASRRVTSSSSLPDLQVRTKLGQTPLEEVREIICLPEFDGSAGKRLHPENVEIPKEVVEQLHLLVSKIASMYNKNPFHNFDHASHVVMSVIKLMSRIVAPSHLDVAMENADEKKKKKIAASLHDHTYGITSDPLTQFACAFSALIHDVDHVGVSNAQLVQEGVSIATKYKERSVAEQNSLDLSWDLLMRPEYRAFRAYLFPSQQELTRFRQLVVNSVMATDIVDKDLKALRNSRWDKAFKKGDSADYVDENPKDEVDRKATIVIEHIIQASDISHTMQHWHVYRKWNQCLFEELYVAYLNGRMEKDPAEFWAKGEIGFFDFYIIPLTKKLKECGVFGVSSGEYLGYALKNREEWVAKGEEVTAEMVEIVHKKYGIKPGKEEEEKKKKVERVEIEV